MKPAKLLRIYLSLILIFILSLLPVVSYGDAIVLPYDNFLVRHKEDCNLLCRFFTSNETATIWENPESSKTLTQVAAQTELYIYYTYVDENDTLWGMIQYVKESDGTVRQAESSEKSTTGWIKMKQFILVYDGIAFMEEHEEDIKIYNGEYDSLTELKNITLWTYPGSDTMVCTIESIQKADYWFSETYTSDFGEKWVYISTADNDFGWILLDESLLSSPTASINTSQTMQPDASLQPSATVRVAKTQIPVRDLYNLQENNLTTLILVLLVLAAVSATAILIRVFIKKKN